MDSPHGADEHGLADLEQHCSHHVPRQHCALRAERAERQGRAPIAVPSLSSDSASMSTRRSGSTPSSCAAQSRKDERVWGVG